MTFNPEKHLIELQGKAYLEVKWRIVWFRQECPQGTIDTEEVVVDLDREVEIEVPTGNWIANPNRPGKKMPEKVVKCEKGYARFRASVTDGKGGCATATKTECAASFPDFIEKAETGAIGRALALLGYGTQFTGDELAEEHRLVDAPVDRSTGSQAASSSSGYTMATAVAGSLPAARQEQAQQQQQQGGTSSLATEQQRASLTRLCQHLGKSVPEGLEKLAYADAKALILELSREYNEQHQSRKAAPSAPAPGAIAPEKKPEEEEEEGEAPASPVVSTMDRTELIEALTLLINDLGGVKERACALAYEEIPQNWGVILGQIKDQREFEKTYADWRDRLADWEEVRQEGWRQSGAPVPQDWQDAYKHYAGTRIFGTVAVNDFKERVLKKNGYQTCALRDMTHHMFDLVFTELSNGATKLVDGVIVSPNYPHPKDAKKAATA